MSTLQNTDLFPVRRGTQTYKVTYADVIKGVVLPNASETVSGIVELATAAETTTGTNNTRAVHPAGLKVALDKKAPLASPALTGTPTAPTAAAGTNNTQLATTAFVKNAVDQENLWDRAGGVLSPHTAGDSIKTGTSEIRSDGTANIGILGIGDAGIKANNSDGSYAGLVNTGSIYLKKGTNELFTIGVSDRVFIQYQGGKHPYWAGHAGPDTVNWLGNATGYGTVSDAAVNIQEGFLPGRTPLRIDGRADHSANLTRWTKNGSEVARIDQNGAYHNNSDSRLKHNVRALPYGLSEILKLDPKVFNWNHDKQDKPTEIFGVIAQDLQKVLPEIVSEGTPDNTGTAYLGLDTTGLTYVLINAVKELAAEVEALKAKLP